MKLLLSFLLSIVGSNAFGQFTDSTNYHIVLSSSGSVNRTNNENAYLLNNSLNFGLKKKSIVLNSSSTWLYGKQNSALSNNDFSTTMNFNLYKTFPHFYYWGLANYNTSYSLQIKNQLLAGVGIAYNFIDKPNAYINLSNGILFDKSSLVELENYTTLRNSLRLQYHFLIKDIITIDGSHFLQNSYARKGDYIIRSATTLGLKIRKWISLTTALNYNKLNITGRENLNLTYGLSVDKYF
ncbi:DUF481 domain-containing protein [Pedobacter sp. Leaf194]|uniref:DUF481 domain-containing protein n=1 Tax=Pedobacter sp. Leaf194 TaxID=1736297 RepID=UPI0007033D35|nr:DUF481 domain-containing protein [Pedobacter sp. Leaf194]KQS34485.1 hypothetical protein ASG14_15310 [Pedobacter sp. Leaf194]